MNKETKETEQIDFVIPWVDGSDPEWVKERNKYSDTPIDVVRYRDWDNLQYWFRAVEKYAPWVHKIYFITWGHLPKWLDTNNPKLVIVNHKDYIPEEYLPTFSPIPIELNLHRIKGLSENFVYFNDDMFLNNTTLPLDFFKDNKPCDTALLNVHCPNRAEAIYDIQINNVRIINTYFDMKESFKKNPNNWFNIKYNLMCNLQNLVFSRCNRYPGFQPLHVCNSYKKSIFEEIWRKEHDTLDMASKNKFRTMYDVNQWLMKDWQIVSNNFYPSNKIKKSKVVYLGVKSKDEEIKAIKKTLNSKKYKFICVNDGYIGEDFDEIKSELKAEFEKKFPFKSSFEK